MIDALGLVILAVVAFAASIFSGASGAGGGFITTPLLIFLGLSPAQAVSSGKFVGLAVAVGSLGGMRQASNRKLWRRALPIVGLAFVIGLSVPFVIVSLDSEIYTRILGVILLLMIPLLIYKKVGRVSQPTNRAKTYVGTGLVGVALWLQGVFSGGMGTLVNVVLMGMMGMSAIEANVTKRYSQIVLNVTIVIGVLWTGLIYWPAAVVGLVAALAGSFVGGRIAVKKGDKFVMSIFLAAMLISGIVLLIS